MNEVGLLGLQMGSPRELEQQGVKGRKGRAEGPEPRVQVVRGLRGLGPQGLSSVSLWWAWLTAGLINSRAQAAALGERPGFGVQTLGSLLDSGFHVYL